MEVASARRSVAVETAASEPRCRGWLAAAASWLAASVVTRGSRNFFCFHILVCLQALQVHALMLFFESWCQTRSFPGAQGALLSLG